jgi:cytochrome b561
MPIVTLRTTQVRYGLIAQAFHWLTAFLVLAAYLVSEGGPEARIYSAAADQTRRVHETLGMAVLGIVVLRLVWKLVDAGSPSYAGPRWMIVAARLVHALLYVLLVAVPLTAILGTWLEGHPLTLAGLDVASWIPPSHDLGRLIIDVHTTVGNVVLWLAGLHAAAALVHHFLLRDAVLTSMLPGRR